MRSNRDPRRWGILPLQEEAARLLGTAPAAEVRGAPGFDGARDVDALAVGAVDALGSALLAPPPVEVPGAPLRFDSGPRPLGSDDPAWR